MRTIPFGDEGDCRLCKWGTSFGFLCWDCVKAMLVGAAGAMGTAAVAWWLR